MESTPMSINSKIDKFCYIHIMKCYKQRELTTTVCRKGDESPVVLKKRNRCVFTKAYTQYTFTYGKVRYRQY